MDTELLPDFKISVISEAGNESDVNFFTLCNTIRRFMMIVSTAYLQSSLC